MLKGRNILLGISGSIAAYKSAFLVRLLVKNGANVKVLMTASAKEFITPLTLSTLSKNPVFSEFTTTSSGEWNNHVKLGLWADLMLIAPASANTIAHMANGICNNLLLATYFSATCPVYFAPAMDLDMYKHPATVENIRKLIAHGNVLINPGNGELASGLSGEGRMEEPEKIIEFVSKHFARGLPLAGKKILVTAGPTYEAIDPVRFIGNHSSGKMGFAIALELSKKGAQVKLVCGPNNLTTPDSFIERIDVESAQQMYEVCMEGFNKIDIAIMSAAVADFAPENPQKQKIKKHSLVSMNIELKPTIDILSKLGEIKSSKQFLVGFALETENEIENARIKLKKKNLDLIVLNSLNDQGAGFKKDTNKITIIHKGNKVIHFGLKSKQSVAEDLVKEIINYTFPKKKRDA